MCRRAGSILLAIFATILSFYASLSLSVAATASGSEIKSHFDLPAEALGKALRDLAVQANCNISYEPSIVAGLQAPAINGDYTVERALSLLLKGTSLRAVNVNADTIQILEPASSTGDADRRERDLQEIVVTGTHIRGTKDSPSPVQVFTRSDIDATGMISVQQFLQTLPQNFGGASENTISSVAARSRTNNTVNGSAPNLRGLGAEATLVLIDGHRVAPGNTDGSFVDISMIPLAAVERVEVITDGASAIYGSDAVGGVVNIILRSKVDGAETRALFGSVGTGSMHNIQAAQTAGDAWATGSAVLSYQYSDQTPLSAASRDYLSSVQLPFSLLPEQVQHAAFAKIDQEIEPGFDLHGDATYSHRSTTSVFSQNAGALGSATSTIPSKIDAYSASLGSTIALPRQSRLAISALYSENDTSQEYFSVPGAAPLVYSVKVKSALISLDVNVDGVLAAVPAGAIHYAVGGQYRRESFGDTYFYPPTDNTFYPSRNVGAGYLEFRIPLLGHSGVNEANPTLEVTLADRAEHYSDFGSTNNPQFGVIWKPLSRVAVRSTYGTSFKAPTLHDLNPVPDQVVLFPGAIFSPSPGGNPNALLVNGGNPQLKPEKATVWTVGVDFKPLDAMGFSANLTYYDIVFKDEIIDAGSSVSIVDVFLDQAILGPQIVQQNPPNSLIRQYVSAPTYVNPFNIDPATIGAVIDDRELNLSTVKTRGLDFAAGYKTTLWGSQLETGIDGTYIFAFDNQFSSTGPVTSFLNMPYEPIDLRLRARASFSRGPWSTGLFLNYTNAYKDTNVVPSGHVASWTTADAVISYEFASAMSATRGLAASLSITNLTDRDPPYVTGYSNYGINYDGINANALGRFFALRLQKRW